MTTQPTIPHDKFLELVDELDQDLAGIYFKQSQVERERRRLLSEWLTTHEETGQKWFLMGDLSKHLGMPRASSTSQLTRWLNDAGCKAVRLYEDMNDMPGDTYKVRRRAWLLPSVVAQDPIADLHAKVAQWVEDNDNGEWFVLEQVEVDCIVPELAGPHSLADALREAGCEATRIWDKSEFGKTQRRVWKFPSTEGDPITERINQIRDWVDNEDWFRLHDLALSVGIIKRGESLTPSIVRRLSEAVEGMGCTPQTALIAGTPIRGWRQSQ